MGRLSTFDEAVVQSIINRLTEGEPLASICRDDGMPAVRTVSDWKVEHPKFAADFACAREDGHDAIASRVRETARGLGDSTADVQRDKLIIETDLKLLAKWDKRYGDKTSHELSGPNGGAIPISAITRTVVDPTKDSD